MSGAPVSTAGIGPVDLLDRDKTAVRNGHAPHLGSRNVFPSPLGSGPHCGYVGLAETHAVRNPDVDRVPQDSFLVVAAGYFDPRPTLSTLSVALAPSMMRQNSPPNNRCIFSSGILPVVILSPDDHRHESSLYHGGREMPNKIDLWILSRLSSSNPMT